MPSGQGAATNGQARPLDDVRVLAIEQYGAGPFATSQLVDLGAEVIKIEDPASGGELERFHAYYPGSAPTAQAPLSAGKTAENLVEARGCAIISATVSRQVA